MKTSERRSDDTHRRGKTISEVLRRVLQEVGSDGKTNAEAVAQAMIDSSKGGNLEAISTVLSRAGVRVKVILDFRATGGEGD